MKNYIVYEISLNTIQEVKDFVDKANKCECDIDLITGKYAVDAKSIMGVFSLDLSKPVQMKVHNDFLPDILVNYVLGYNSATTGTEHCG